MLRPLLVTIIIDNILGHVKVTWHCMTKRKLKSLDSLKEDILYLLLSRAFIHKAKYLMEKNNEEIHQICSFTHLRR